MKRLLSSFLALPLLFAAAPVLAAGPTIGTVSPASPTANTPVTLQANVSSSAGVQSCHLYIESEDIGEMTINGNVASRMYTFTRGGVHTAFVFCRDMSGGMASGPNTSINVQGMLIVAPPLSNPVPTPTNPTPAPTTPTPSPTTSTFSGKLVKLHCAAGALADDICKAVYFVTADGKRHAFPNSRVFFTWYQNFNSVQEVTMEQMSQFQLGRNVGYRPGIRMVKFTTDPKVYAVGRGGILRWISTEAVAVSIYGPTWNTMIDDIPDTFYLDYTFGANIAVASDFNATTEQSSATTIEANAP